MPGIPTFRSVRLFAVASLWVWAALCSGQVSDRGYFRFLYDNDFFNDEDRYYTQGVGMEYSAPFIARSPVSRVLLGLGDGSIHRQVLFAQQECYTPASIRSDTILTGDRPFAAALYLGQRSISIDTVGKMMLSSSIILGILGPCAFCAEAQEGIHRALDNIEPLGWQYQVANALIVNYAVELGRRLYRSPSLEVSGSVTAEAGTYRTNIGALARSEAGKFTSSFDAAASSDHFQLSAFLEGGVRVIGYDATMQGGLFDDDSPHTLPAEAIERVVLKGGGGIRLRYGSLDLLYSRTFVTREFEGGADHGWGSAIITVMF